MIKIEGGRARSVRTPEEELNLLRQKWGAFSEEEQRFIMELMNRSDSDAERILAEIKSAHYHREPVDIDTFLDDEYYSGPGGSSVYPKLREELREIFRGDYSEVILSGGIGWGKSYTATYGLMYSIYRTTCLRDPQSSFGLAPGTIIWFAFLSMYRKHAGETIFEDIRTKIEASPYFYELMDDTKGSGFSKYQATISKNLKLICESSTANKVIGLNVFGGMLDEVNFGESARVAKDAVTLNTAGKTPPTKVEKVYRSIIARINSRFMRNGSVPGVLFVVSSKNNETDFTQKRIQEALNDPSVYVMDFPEWETKPPEKYSGEKFRVFFGGKTMRSRVLKGGEDPPEVTDDLQRIVEVPVEHKEQFVEGDIEVALRDIAGIAVPRVMPFIQRTDVIHGMYYDRKDPLPLKSLQWVSGRQEPFRWDVLCECGKPRKLGDQVEINWVPRINPDAPRHIHIDPSKNGDATGFAMGHIEKMVEVTQRDTHTGELYKELMPLIYVDIALQVLPPDEGEIEMELLRKLVYSLTGHGFPVHYISTDQNQTVDMIQQFEKKGYQAEVRSLDRKPTGYKHLKNALYQRRLRCYNYHPLNEELENLQWDSAKDKVDHPTTLADGRAGSKDVADSVAGVVWSLTDMQTGAPPVVKPDEARSKPDHPLEHWMDVGQNPNARESDAGPLFGDTPFLFGGGD